MSATSSSLRLTFHGAAQTVTGSCMELAVGDRRLLVDCGMFQGSRSLERLNYQPFAFNPRDIDAVVLTHAHIDHSGLIPKLVSGGYRGTIWCTSPTKDLLRFMLEDAAHLQMSEAERHNRRRDRAGETAFEPLYTDTDALQAVSQCRPVPFDQWFELFGNLRIRLWNAGHVLGAASVEVEANGTTILFSGDLGPARQSFLAPPNGPQGVDHLVCESTYGGRHRQKVSMDERRALLGRAVREALDAGGNLIIPVFALERTQELLLDLAEIAKTDPHQRGEVFIDAPLASRLTSVFAAHSSELRDVGGRNVFDNPKFHFVEATEESIRLNHISGAIILAGSGMCEGGRVRHHLLHNLHRRDSTILFVGYQAAGTLGRVILDGAKTVRISGQDVRVRANVRSIDHYSAHGDHDDLIAWIEARGPVRGSLFLDHGEPGATSAIENSIKAASKEVNVRIPAIGETFDLPPSGPATSLGGTVAGFEQLIGRDWENDYAEFATTLKQKLLQFPSDRDREAALVSLRRTLEQGISRP